jgi:hypothetical protein
MEVQEMEGGIIAIKCIDGQDAGWLSTIPPLGTINEDLRLTREDSSVTCTAGTYKVSQPYMGRFERFVGKVGLSDTEDQVSSDNNDVETGPDKVKSYENITLNLDMTTENNKARLQGAAKGGWDYTARGYYRHPSMRLYEVIIATGPNVQSLDFSSAEQLKRFIGIRIERKEMEYGNPNKFRLPMFARRCVTLPNWVEPTTVKVVDNVTVAASTNYSASAQIQTPKVFHTRLKCVFSAVQTAGPLVIRGTNFFGEEIEESITLTGTGTITYITKNYFNTIETSGIQLGAGWASATTLKLDITEYDCKIKP